MYKYSLIPVSKQVEFAAHVLIVLNVIQANLRCAFLDVLGLSDPSVFTFFFTFAMAPNNWMWSFCSAIVMFCVVVSVEKTGKVKCTNTTCRWTQSKQSGLVKCELLQKVRERGVCGSPLCILSFLHWKKTSLNSNAMLQAYEKLYTSELVTVAHKFDLRYDQWNISWS